MVLIQQIVNGVMLGASYSLIAIGYTLVFGVLHLVHLAHGEVFMIGAFIGLQVVLLTGYRAEAIQEHFARYPIEGIQITYSREPHPLGTGGAIRLAAGVRSAYVILKPILKRQPPSSTSPTSSGSSEYDDRP